MNLNHKLIRSTMRIEYVYGDKIDLFTLKSDLIRYLRRSLPPLWRMDRRYRDLRHHLYLHYLDVHQRRQIAYLTYETEL